VNRINFPALIFVLSGVSVMVISFGTRAHLPISRETSRLWGMIIFLLGMTLFTWAGLCLKNAFFGTVEPVSDRIIKDGPYHWVRHPLYLSMIISLIGISLMLRSIWGIIGVFVFFLPSVVYRAQLEEQALAGKFGIYWEEYVVKTTFLVPLLW
jgi:protein-S-isoprenylcysteine O-methyltransferase Ste14